MTCRPYKTSRLNREFQSVPTATARMDCNHAHKSLGLQKADFACIIGTYWGKIMRPIFKLLSVSAVLLLFIVGLSKCASNPNPGVAPAPPIEIPVMLNFATSVKVDASEIKSTAAASLSAGKATYTPAQIETTIKLGGDLAAAVNLFSEVPLAVFRSGDNRISVPTNPNYNQCQFDSSGASCNGSKIDGSKINPIKMDFADFDLDGNGANEGCSGSTCPINCNAVSYCPVNSDGTFGCPTQTSTAADIKPICVRLWLKNVDAGDTDYKRFIGMRMDRIPCSVRTGALTCLSQAEIDAADSSQVVQNPGLGEYRATITFYNQQESSINVDNARNVGVVYDHFDLAASADVNKKSIDVNLKELKNLAGSQELLATTKTRSIVNQETITGSTNVRKKVTEDNTFSDTYTLFGGNTFLQYLAQFLENGNYWSGTVHSSAGDIEFTALCARLTASGSEPMGTEVAQSFCTGEQIDVTGITLPAYNDASTAFPNTTIFPSSPTF